MEIEEKIKKAKNGDKEAVTDLIYNIRHELYKIAKMRLSCDADIEDVIQETTIEVFKSIKKLKNASSYKSWIIKILINKCNKVYYYRKKNQISYENLELDDFFTSHNNKSESDLEFYHLLDGLNYDERMAIILFYMEDYPIKEIAEILRTNQNTIKTRLKRAKEKIKKNIKEW